MTDYSYHTVTPTNYTIYFRKCTLVEDISDERKWESKDPTSDYILSRAQEGGDNIQIWPNGPMRHFNYVNVPILRGSVPVDVTRVNRRSISSIFTINNNRPTSTAPKKYAIIELSSLFGISFSTLLENNYYYYSKFLPHRRRRGPKFNYQPINSMSKDDFSESLLTSNDFNFYRGYYNAGFPDVSAGIIGYNINQEDGEKSKPSVYQPTADKFIYTVPLKYPYRPNSNSLFVNVPAGKLSFDVTDSIMLQIDNNDPTNAKMRVLFPKIDFQIYDRNALTYNYGSLKIKRIPFLNASLLGFR